MTMAYSAEDRMELFIETLTGTAFELSCSPTESIASIKSKIQFSEGIPSSQQHLIWRSEELLDDLCLQDYSICDGATIKLVLGLRGGPINSKQDSDTKSWKELTDYLERNSECSTGGKPFTVLVFHDGDKIQMYTLIDKGDNTVGLLSSTAVDTNYLADAAPLVSIKNIEEFNEELNRENEITREKVHQLQDQLKMLSISKPKKQPSHPPRVRHSGSKPQPTAKKKYSFHLPPLRGSVSPPTHYFPDFDLNVIRRVENPGLTPTPDPPTNPKPKAKPTKQRISVTSYIATTPEEPICLPAIETQTTQRFSNPDTPRRVASGVSLSQPSYQTFRETLPFTTRGCTLTSRRLLSKLDEWLQKRPKTSPEKLSVISLDLEAVPLLEDEFGKGARPKRPKDIYPNVLDIFLGRTAEAGVEDESGSDKDKKFSSQVPQNVDHFSTCGNTKSQVKKLSTAKRKKNYKRCGVCSKKTGLATSYICRCGRNFCASHRYAELHYCTYDYKTEGRRLLQLNNPVIVAPKLPKI